MRTRLGPSVVSIVILCSACASTHGPEEPIASGVYSLTVRTDVDHCSPARFSGSAGQVAVVSTDGRVSIPVPQEAGDPSFEVTRRVTLEDETGFHVESVSGMDACPTARAHHTWTLVDRDGGTFEVEHAQRYEGLAGCGPMEDAPEADCETVRDLEFALLERCNAPCELVWSPGSGVACSCE